MGATGTPRRYFLLMDSAVAADREDQILRQRVDDRDAHAM